MEQEHEYIAYAGAAGGKASKTPRDLGPQASEAIREAGAVYHTTARDRFTGIEPGISVRQGMSRRSYEFFRPGEALPRDRDSLLATCDHVHRHNPIVQFAVNLMTDFVVQGIGIFHTAASKEKRYNHWWKKVKGKEVSSALVKLVLRDGVAVVKRNFADLNAGDVKDLDSTQANDVDYVRAPKVRRNRIPIQYTFLNPRVVDVLGGDLAMFAATPDNPPRYGLRIPSEIWKQLKNPRTPDQVRIVAGLPAYIRDAVAAGDRVVPLEPEKVAVVHYKKDDWKAWADPLILSILSDITLYERMKQADRAALDGSISKIRLWKLGMPDKGIVPGPGLFKRLRDQLQANVGGGSMDLVWDAAIDLQETSSDAAVFLGSAKYEQVLRDIYAGLGIPQSLTGESGGLTNNALSLKTLMERLQYARDLLVEFWEAEFAYLQRAFGDRKPARLRFELMSLSDDAAEKMIWIQLWDRNVVTTETIREKFGLLDDIEVARLRKEYRLAEEGDVPAKIGPFTEAQPHPDQLAKAAMQQGTIAPSEAGVKARPRKKGDRSLLDRQEAMQQQQIDLAKEQAAQQAEQGQDLHDQKLKQNDDLHRQRLAQRDAEHRAILPVKVKQAKAKGQPGQGRPRNSGDTQPRKRRTPKPRSAAAQLWVRAAQRAIAEAVTPAYLARAGKANVRSLNAAEVRDLEALRYATLCSLEPGDPLDGLAMADLTPTPEAEAALRAVLEEHAALTGKAPTAEELRDMHAIAYATLHDPQ